MHQAHRGAPWLGSYSVDLCIRHLKGNLGGVLLCSLVCKGFDRPASLSFSCQCWQCWCVWGERLWWWLYPLRVTQQYCLASTLPGFPPQAFPTTISSLTSPQSVSPQSIATLNWDCPTIPKLQLPATAPSRRPTSLPNICMATTRTVWLSFHLGCHRSAVSLLALDVSPLTQTTDPLWGLDPCFSSPHPLRAGPVLLRLLFFPLVPLSYQVLHGCMYSFLHTFYSFLHISILVRSSCPLSAGFCIHFFVWRCILDVSMERNVFHIHLCPPTPCHLVLLSNWTVFWSKSHITVRKIMFETVMVENLE